jgi:glycosyltransferase involved in cell wall biosynthesis
VVIPLLINLKVEADVDVAVASRLSEERERGCSRWLFVGQIAPHKAQHALIEALAFYREAYGAASLHLVGRVMSPGYAGGLQRLARALGVEAAVHFEGLVSDSALAAFYSGADAFVCCSDHEGFCAPLIEAMYNQLAVVAFGAGAVPETIGEAGIVLPAKTPSLIAAAVHRVLSDRRLRVRLVEAGAQRALNFDLERTRTSFARAIEAAVRVR